MASLTSAQTDTALERKPLGVLSQFSSSWILALVLAVALLVSTGSLTILAQRQATTIADQEAVIRQQANMVGHYEQTHEALLRTAHQYAARLMASNEVAELDRAIFEVSGQLQAQQLVMERTLHEGGQAFVEAAMVERMLQHSLDNLLAQRQIVLAR